MYTTMMRQRVDNAIQQATRHASHEGVFFRASTCTSGAESFEALAVQAQTAESVTGRYGMTLWSQNQHPDTTPSAPRNAITRFFPVENTPPGSAHYTLYFRKPLSRLQTDTFNLLFYGQFTPSAQGDVRDMSRNQTEAHQKPVSHECDPLLYSYGWQSETVKLVRKKAETAERIIGEYGITVWAWASSPKEPLPCAKLSVVQQTFEVKQTTDDAFHYTIIFRKPVTQEQVDRFHVLFTKEPS